MKIKDLSEDKNLGGIKIKIPDGHSECPLKEGYWRGQWGYKEGKAGIWVSETLSSGRIYPIFLDKIEESLEFEIVK